MTPDQKAKIQARRDAANAEAAAKKQAKKPAKAAEASDS